MVSSTKLWILTICLVATGLRLPADELPHKNMLLKHTDGRAAAERKSDFCAASRRSTAADLQ